MIRTWIADITGLLDEKTYLKYYNEAPDFRKEKADRMVHMDGKVQSIGVWTLYERMRQHYHIPEHAVFNLSHSDRYVLCSIDDEAKEGRLLGCDIEEVKELRMNVARRYFCESEFQRVKQMETEEKQVQEFYRFWVLKESFMKATRLGMKLGLDEFEITFDETDHPYLIRQPEAFPQKYYYKEYAVEGIPYKLAVCSDCDIFEEEITCIIL